MSISLEEYRESVLVLHVVPGRGKTGQAHRGPVRWLIADSAGLCDLRTEAARVYCANGFEGDPEAKPKADWVNGFVAAVLGVCAGGSVGWTDLVVVNVGNGGRPLLLVNDASRAGTLPACSLIRAGYKLVTGEVTHHGR